MTGKCTNHTQNKDIHKTTTNTNVTQITQPDGSLAHRKNNEKEVGRIFTRQATLLDRAFIAGTNKRSVAREMQAKRRAILGREVQNTKRRQKNRRRGRGRQNNWRCKDKKKKK